mmetsp:Transcript_42636/g.166432  ORF Transcript_42636/g.166432 Transcript_42636/m.166432 type:complete len:187 (-) Transcript_42636:243-803(-)
MNGRLILGRTITAYGRAYVRQSVQAHRGIVRGGDIPFETDVRAGYVGRTPKCSLVRYLAIKSHPTAADWSEHEFYSTADSTLTSLHDSIEVQSDKLGGEFDIELSMGVLTVTLGNGLGSYVVNTQTPNRQLWLSSPKSGPARYYWDFHERQWRSSRDDSYLREKLNGELTELCGISIPLQEEGDKS